MVVLAELGFGLDLERCAATGTIADLAYVSPRTGRAVSAEAGAPYRDRLLALPPFLRHAADAQSSAPADVLDGLALTGFFLEQRAFAPHGRSLPPARSRFVDVMQQFATISSR
jgi:DNA repair protein RecO (recombination protein O)